jgi:hypothetical protein
MKFFYARAFFTIWYFMKKYLIVVVVIIVGTCCLTLFSVYLKTKQERVGFKILSKQIDFFDEKGKLKSKQLRNLLSITQVKHHETFSSIVDETQKKWLRPQEKERWELDNIFPKDHKIIVSLLHDLGCVDAIFPSQKHYDYVLFFGGTVGGVRNCFSYLLKLWKKGIRFKSLIVLGGERSLDPKIENKETLLNIPSIMVMMTKKKNWQWNRRIPQTETDMMKLVFDHIEFPNDFKTVEVVFVNAQQVRFTDGTMRRPTTGDTIEKWLLKKPIPGTCLAISSQPHIGYQHSVLQTLLPSQFSVETVGAEVSQNIKIAVYLDSLARRLYQEQKFHSLHSS